MDKDNETSMPDANRENIKSSVTLPSDIALRLLEAERLLHLHESVEDVLAHAPDPNQGCRALLRATCEALGASTARLHFHDRSAPDLVWPGHRSYQPTLN